MSRTLKIADKKLPTLSCNFSATTTNEKLKINTIESTLLNLIVLKFHARIFTVVENEASEISTSSNSFPPQRQKMSFFQNVRTSIENSSSKRAVSVRVLLDPPPASNSQN